MNGSDYVEADAPFSQREEALLAEVRFLREQVRLLTDLAAVLAKGATAPLAALPAESELERARRVHAANVERMRDAPPVVRVPELLEGEGTAARDVSANAVEDAIRARAFDPMAERHCRSFASMMKAQGWAPKKIAEAILSGRVAAPSFDETYGQVVR